MVAFCRLIVISALVNSCTKVWLDVNDVNASRGMTFVTEAITPHANLPCGLGFLTASSRPLPRHHVPCSLRIKIA